MLIFIFGLVMALGDIALTDRTRSSYELAKLTARTEAESATDYAFAWLSQYTASSYAPTGATVVPGYYPSGTVVMNGVKIHDHVECNKATGSEIDNKVNEPGPIFLQGDHGTVSFRNIRIKELPKE